jgi:hypothetical protein
MDQLHDDSKVNVARADCASGSARKESQSGPEPFTTAATRVINVTLNGRVECSGLFSDSLFDSIEVRVDHLDRMSKFCGGDVSKSSPCEKFHKSSLGLNVLVVNFELLILVNGPKRFRLTTRSLQVEIISPKDGHAFSFN